MFFKNATVHYWQIIVRFEGDSVQEWCSSWGEEQTCKKLNWCDIVRDCFVSDWLCWWHLNTLSSQVRRLSRRSETEDDDIIVSAGERNWTVAFLIPAPINTEHHQQYHWPSETCHYRYVILVFRNIFKYFAILGCNKLQRKLLFADSLAKLPYKITGIREVLSKMLSLFANLQYKNERSANNE